MSVQRSATLLSFIVVCGSVVTGCAAGSISRSPAVAQPDDDRTPAVSVVVSNEHLAEITVFVVRGNERRVLGRVLPQAHARFAIAGRLIQPGLDLRLAVESRTSRYATEPLLVEPGQTLAFNVQQNVNMSSVAVR